MAKAMKEKAIESPEILAEFLRGAEECGCVKIKVTHLIAGQESGSPVAEFDISDDGETGAHFNAEDIHARMLSDAEAIGGVQRYVLLAFREGQKSPRDRFIFRLDGGGQADASSSEPANAHGLVAQAHRHIEAMMRGFQGSLNTLVNGMANQNRILAEQLEKAHEEKGEMWALMGEIHKQDRERVALEAKIKREDKRDELLGEGLKFLLPGIINKVAPSKEAKDATVVGLVKSLTSEQQAVIFGALNAEQRAALGMILDEGISKEKATEEAKKEGN